LVWQFLTFLDTQVEALLPARYNPENYLPFSLPGVGLLVVVGFLTLVGMLTANLGGRTLVRMGERLLSRMPVVRSVYGTLKQIFETVLAQSSRSFREVVLIEYPRRGIGAIGFVTGPTRGEIQTRADEELINLIHLDMSIEEGIKLVISGGIVAPPRDGEVEALPPRSAPGRPKDPEAAPQASVRIAAR
jgi:uncharacterized membrane protein